ncbi:MAG: sulfotransferase family protein [Phycisphaerae bacterium]
MEKKNQLQARLADTCLLLGGNPRSGTTLLSSILRCAPGHVQAFELHVRKPSFIAGLEGRYTRRIFEQVGLPNDEYDRILAETDTSGMNLGAWVGPKDPTSAEELTGREGGDFQAQLACRCAFVQRCMRRIAERNGEGTWGFKLLTDSVYADRFARIWPGATLILMIRDPRDQAMSVLKLNEQRIERGQPVFYPDHRAAALGWAQIIRDTRAAAADAPLNLVEIRYEDLVTDPDATLERLGALTGLELSSGLSFYEADFIRTHTERFRHHDNLKRPINADSVGKWKTKLDAPTRQVFAETVGGLMDELGYEV